MGFPRWETLLLVPVGWVCINIIFQIIPPDFVKCFGSIVPFLSYFISLTALHIWGDPWCQKKVKGTIICLAPNLCYASSRPFYYHCLHNSTTMGCYSHCLNEVQKKFLVGLLTSIRPTVQYVRTLFNTTYVLNIGVLHNILSGFDVEIDVGDQWPDWTFTTSLLWHFLRQEIGEPQQRNLQSSSRLQIAGPCLLQTSQGNNHGKDKERKKPC